MKTLISSVLMGAAIAMVSMAKADGPFYDNFGDARYSAGYNAVEGNVIGTNVGATPQNGEPIRPRLSYSATTTVWFKWMARETCDVLFVAEGTGFGTVMGVYKGTSVGGLTTIALGPLNSGARENSSECTFRAIKGTTYYVCISGAFGETGQIKLRWAKEPPPDGPLYDDFGAARTSTGSNAASGSVTGTNVGATPQKGEPYQTENWAQYASDLTSTVWFKWKAPATGATTFTANGNGFDTIISVYTGTSVRALDYVSIADENSTTFHASKGVTYFICIAGDDGATGPITLSWNKVSPPNGPLYDDFGSARTSQGYASDTGEFTGTNVGATPQNGEPLLKRSADLTSTVWFKWKAPYSAEMMFVVDGYGGRDVIGVYTGTSVGSLTTIREGCDLEDTPGLEGWFYDWGRSIPSGVSIFNAIRGTTYYICIASEDGNITEKKVSWECRRKFDPPNGPLYDDYGSARTSLASAAASGAVAGTNVGATPQNGEPLRYFWPSATATVWFKWKAPFSGTVEFSTAGSAFNAAIGVFIGNTSVGDLLMRTIGTGKLSCSVMQGNEYFICVGGPNGEEGAVRLSWARYGLNGPDFFDCFGAARASTGSNAPSGSNVRGTNDGATLENGEPLKKFASRTRATVWFKWTAPATCDMVFTGYIYSDNQTQDSVMGVYTGTSVGSLTKVAENDDSSTEAKWSRVTFRATKGTTYYVCIGDGGRAKDIGEVRLDWAAAQ